MKRWSLIAVGIIVVIGTIVLIHQAAKDGGSSLPAQTSYPIEEGTTLHVDEFMMNVNRFQGLVRIHGVVSIVSPKRRMLGLIDTQEFQECGVTPCANLILPVRWSGSMPEQGDTVQDVLPCGQLSSTRKAVTKCLSQALELINLLANQT